MKSYDWAMKFLTNNSAEDQANSLQEYADETRDLIDIRTKFSEPKRDSKVDKKDVLARKKSVIEGAVREQRQKWVAICSRVQNLLPEMFDGLMSVHLNDINLLLSGKPAVSVVKQEEDNSGRTLVKAS